MTGIRGRVRIVHPFPTVLVATTTGLLTWIAGGEPSSVIRASLAMAGIQAGIGALNDVVDRGRDAARPSKPIPRGSVSVRTARAVAVAGFALGLGLSALGGPAVAVVAMAGAMCGIVYDVRLARTAWSWLPLAAALPLVPVYAWLVATGSVPNGFLRLVPAAVAAGAGLAIANAAADAAIDAPHGRGGIATRLSPGRSRLLASGLLVVAVLVVGPSAPWRLDLPAVLWAGGLALVSLGTIVAIRGGRGWEIQAIGIALAGASALFSIGGSSS